MEQLVVNLYRYRITTLLLLTRSKSPTTASRKSSGSIRYVTNRPYSGASPIASNPKTTLRQLFPDSSYRDIQWPNRSSLTFRPRQATATHMAQLSQSEEEKEALVEFD